MGTAAATQCFNTNETETILCMGFLGLSSSVVCATSAVLVFVCKLHFYFVHRLALYQVLAAFFYGLALTFELLFLVVQNDDENYLWLCKTVSFFFHYFTWVKLLFTAWLVVHLFCLAVFYKDLQKDYKGYEVLCVIISIMVPPLFLWIPFVNEAYGPAGAWCSIESWKDNCIDNISIAGVTEQFVLWHVPAMICSIVESIAIIVIVLCLLFYYRPDDDDAQDESASLLPKKKRHNALKELLPLLAYPILFCVLLIPPLINRIIGAADTDQLNMKAILASGISIPLQPFFAGLTLFIHVVVLKVHSCRRTESQTSTNYTYPNAWVFTSAIANQHHSSCSSAGPIYSYEEL